MKYKNAKSAYDSAVKLIRQGKMPDENQIEQAHLWRDIKPLINAIPYIKQLLAIDVVLPDIRHVINAINHQVKPDEFVDYVISATKARHKYTKEQLIKPKPVIKQKPTTNYAKEIQIAQRPYATGYRWNVPLRRLED